MELEAYKTPSGRLREAGAREILRRKACGDTYQKIAQDLDVSIGTVFNVVKGNTRSWIHG